MTIFKYIRKSDNSLIGYHLDSFCSVGPKEQAKQYMCETPEEIERQMEIIKGNFKYIINGPKKDSFVRLITEGRPNQFGDLLFSEIELVAEVIMD